MHDPQTRELIGHRMLVHREELLDTASSVYHALRHCRALIEGLEDASDRGEPLKSGTLDSVLGTCEASARLLSDDLSRLMTTEANNA